MAGQERRVPSDSDRQTEGAFRRGSIDGLEKRDIYGLLSEKRDIHGLLLEKRDIRGLLLETRSSAFGFSAFESYMNPM